MAHAGFYIAPNYDEVYMGRAGKRRGLAADYKDARVRRCRKHTARRLGMPEQRLDYHAHKTVGLYGCLHGYSYVIFRCYA